MIILGGILLLAAISFAVVGSSTKNSSVSLLTQNVEALASYESIMDQKVWSVDAESSQKWTCYPNGSSACPAP